MSLEQALQENTEAIRQLMEVVKAAGIAGVATEVDTVKTKSAKVAAPVKVEELAAIPEPLKSDTPALKYEDAIQGPFLKLVQKDRAAALAIMIGLGLKSMKEIASKPETFAAVAAQITEALNA